MSQRLWFVILLVVIGRSVPAEDTPAIGAKSPPTVHDIGSRRELFVDAALVDRLLGKAELRLHHPVPREVVLVHDAAWEGNASAYHSIFKDGDLYRMYYRAWRLTHTATQLIPSKECLCYAESDDGIHWRKPDLGLHEFQGSKANNIVLSPEWAERHKVAIGGPAIFRDENPAAAPDARYKTFITSRSPLGMRPFKSPDGVRWSPMSDGPTITEGAFDSQNLVFWDSLRSEYRAYWRIFTKGTTNEKTWKPEGVRAIRTATSKDLLRWENQADLTYVDSPEEQLYENGIAPYHRAPHLLIGFPVRYVDRGLRRKTVSADDGSDKLGPEDIQRWSASLRALPGFEHRAMRAKLSERYGSALTEGLMMVSRDGASFKRWNEAFLRPGIERTGTWNYGHNLIGWQMVETKSEFEGAPNELSFYATEGYSTSSGTSLRRHTLRLDGFVSAQAPMSGGELITKPMKFSGKTLSLNFATSAAGSLQVELQDEYGKPLPGHALNDCEELFGDTIDRGVTWNTNPNLSSIVGQTIRIRFVLRDADLFSFQFRDE